MKKNPIGYLVGCNGIDSVTIAECRLHLVYQFGFFKRIPAPKKRRLLEIVQKKLKGKNPDITVLNTICMTKKVIKPPFRNCYRRDPPGRCFLGMRAIVMSRLVFWLVSDVCEKKKIWKQHALFATDPPGVRFFISLGRINFDKSSGVFLTLIINGVFITKRHFFDRIGLSEPKTWMNS